MLRLCSLSLLAIAAVAEEVPPTLVAPEPVPVVAEPAPAPAAVATDPAAAPPVVAEPVPAAPEIPPPAPAPVVAEPSKWTTAGKATAALMSVRSGDSSESRDPVINGAANSTTYLLSLDASLTWTDDPWSVEQLLKVRYGQSQNADEPFQESADEVRYDGVLRRSLGKPHYIYNAWGAESTFTSPDPENYRFNPITAKASAGYGQLYENFQEEASKFDARAGVRAQKSWGSLVPEIDRSIQVGPEFFARYEHTVFKREDRSLNYFAQYEAFAEFNDMAHVTNLVTAGLTAQISRYILVDLALRAYYETTPKEFEDTTPAGYNSWSMVQQSTVGLTYIW
jgi:hypothetical protein